MGKVRQRELASGGLVVDDSGQVLLVVDRHGRWALPKGHQEKGEQLWQTACREVAEETGVEATVVRYLGRMRYPLPNQPALEKVVVVWLMRATSGQPRPSDETAVVAYMPWPDARARLRDQGYPGAADQLDGWLARRVPGGLVAATKSAAARWRGTKLPGRVDRI